MRIGIDLGGTKMEIVLLDQEGKILFQQRTPTPQGDYAQTLATLRDTLLPRLISGQLRLPEAEAPLEDAFA